MKGTHCERREAWRKIAGTIILTVALCLFSALIYKTQVSPVLNSSLTWTLATLSKPKTSYIMTSDADVFEETFLCVVPKVRSIQLKAQGRKFEKSDGSIVLLELRDNGSGELLLRNEYEAAALNGTQQTLSLKGKLDNSEGKEYTLSVCLLNAGDGSLELECNEKYGLVRESNGGTSSKQNVIYSIRFSAGRDLKILYFIICICLIIFAGMAWLLLVIKQKTPAQAFLPIAIMLGTLITFILPVNSIPDESSHFDAAYYYSDLILRVPGTGHEGTIYKRSCDAVLQDSLANTLEGNHYYQLKKHFLESALDSELTEVPYTITSHIVPGFTYFPAAIGISFGRLLHLGAFSTFTLGRLFDLLVYVLLVSLSLRLMPFGRNLTAMICLLPISLQQAASASYDAVLMGILFLTGALFLSFWNKERLGRLDIIAASVLSGLLAISKGGVYLPVLLLLGPVFIKRIQGYRNRGTAAGRTGIQHVRKAWLIVLCAFLAGIAAAGIYMLKFRLTMATILGQDANGGTEMTYGAGMFIRAPQKLIYMLWKTLIDVGDTHLRDLFGGRLSWLQVKTGWPFLLFLLIGVLLLVHTEEDRMSSSWREKAVLLLAASCVVLLVDLSMLLAYTVTSSSHIQGIQGRYYLPVFHLFLLGCTTDMVHVGKKQASIISFTMIFVEILMLMMVFSKI